MRKEFNKESVVIVYLRYVYPMADLPGRGSVCEAVLRSRFRRRLDKGKTEDDQVTYFLPDKGKENGQFG